MKALPRLLTAALFLAPIFAQAGAVIREDGAVYLEDFIKQPVRLAVLAAGVGWQLRVVRRSPV